MFRIDTAGHVANRFDDTINEGIGKYPTIVSSAWLNSIQEELVAVATSTGGALNKANTGQVLDAIQTMIINAVNYSAAGLQNNIDDLIAMVNAQNGTITAQNATITAMTPHLTPLLGGRWLHTTDYPTTHYQEPMGQSLLRADFPDAWAAIQASDQVAASHAAWLATPTMWGPGVDGAHFDMKDLRSVFLRVANNGKVGALGPGVGGYKANQNKSHSHTLPSDESDGSGVNRIADSDGIGADHSPSTGLSGGDEAVPDHTSLVYTIRMK